MKKQGLKVTSKVLAGLALLTGVTSLPTNAVEANNVAVDVNVKEVNASVYEKDGHYYARLVADKEVANVVARIVADNKSEFTIKRDIIKAGEVVEVELDLKADQPTKKLPQTSVERKTLNVTSKAGSHEFKISLRYEVATPEVKAQQEENKKATEKVDKDTKPTVTLDELTNGKTNEEPKNEVKPTEQPAEVVKPAETPKPAAPAEAPKTEAKPAEVATPNVPKPETGDAKPSDKPAGATSLFSAPVAAAKKAPTVMNNPAPQAAPVVQTQATPAAQTQTAPATSREEQIKRAYINKVNTLRTMNGLKPLKENSALNASTKARSLTVLNSALTANVHGPAGSLEKAAAAAAGYANSQKILYNVAVNTDSGTPDQVAQKLLDTLFKEINNVTTAFPYGHRNTLLAKTATELGVGVSISNGRVSLVQHQDNHGAFDGINPIPAKYLDGKSY